jgi:hypothetical protein
MSGDFPGHDFVFRLWNISLMDFYFIRKMQLPRRLPIESRMIDLQRDGEDGDDLVFKELGLPSKLKTVAVKDVREELEKSDAALLKYQTSSGVPHQLAFGRFFGRGVSNDRCWVHDSNRWSAVGKCSVAIKMLKAIIDRSSPEHVKMNYMKRS